MNNIGIYKITNIKNNKVYIGSSKQLNVRKRKHFGMLRNNKHHSIHLQRAYNKNKQSFIFEILEYCEEEELLNRENYYLNLLCKSNDYIQGLNDDFLKLSYNVVPFAVKGFGGKHRLEIIQKFKLSHPLRKDILCYTQDGELYASFSSSKDAEIKTGVSKNSILILCKTKRYVGRTYVFGFKEDKEFIKFIKNSEKPIKFKVHNKGKIFSKEEKANMPWCTPIEVINLETNEILKFSSQKEACDYFKLQPCTINRCLKTNKPYKKKLLFKYYDIVRSS